MDINAVQTSYARWAPFYDHTFGAITNIGRRRAVYYINHRGGSVLEVGVGTGLSLQHYGRELQVTGIDYSPNMLEKARARVARLGLAQVTELRQMDARNLDFDTNSFDTIAAMHVLSVVPNPETVMAEMARVCKPGGKIVIANHFVRTKGVLAVLEKFAAPFANQIGWHSDFPIETVLKQKDLSLEKRVKLPPFGMMTFLVLTKPLSVA